MKKLNQNGFGAVEALLIVVIVGIIGGAGYMVYNSQKKTNQSLDSTSNSLESASLPKEEKKEENSADSSETTNSTDNTLVAGQVDFDLENMRGQTGVIYIDGYAITDNLSEIWLEYGKSPDNLTSQTERNSKEIGLGEAGKYGNWTFVIKTNELESGTNYFYRVAAKTKSGNTIYSGVAAFTSKK